ncbi:MAG TPA: lipoyl(octanoyl) transferase LipB [Chthonomonadaceae bacterium]|nr:lipoyl(octanoyl) transferase LipB [Chthonomonadaceae bacterium]
MQMPVCEVRWLGRRDYREVWEMQRTLAARRLAGEIPDTLLLLEHPPTVTLGRGAEPGNVVMPTEWLAKMGFDVVETDRGGDVTYHGPGQLVGYPILNLQSPPHRPDLHLYLRNLEETLIRALAHYGIEGGRFPGYTGAWVGMGTPRPEKVAAIGIKTSRWITQHGFAFNVCPDLSHFDVIVPCGIRDYGVTSLTRLLNRSVTVEEVLPVVESAFSGVFGLDCVPSDPEAYLAL